MTEAELLGRRRSPHYNCVNLVVESWYTETGQDISATFQGVLVPKDQRLVQAAIRGDFTPVPQPVSPCLVLFRCGKATPHLGLFVRGKVLHLSERGPVRQLIANASLGYDSVKFYAHC
jgi:hypothetical protein